MTAKGVAKDFGHYLRTCRRSKGMTLEIVSDHTKITAEILRRIENEHLAQLPAPVFVKGFIRAFSGAVGADPAEALLRFENRLGTNDGMPIRQAHTPKAPLNWHHLLLIVMLFAALVGATLYLANWIHHKQPMPSQPPSEVVKSTLETTPALTDNLDPREEPATLEPENRLQVADETPEIAETFFPPEKIEEPVPISDDNLNLHINAVQDSWLKVVSDDKTPREFLLKKNQNVTLTAERQFNLIIGNAGGVRLELNGQPVSVAGASGKVVKLRLP